MSIDLPHHQILYVSRIAPGHGRDAFVSICRVARRRNAELAMTGALLFDGHRFCQLLQGPARNVKALMTRIAIDPRHDGLQVLYDDPIGCDMSERSWRFAECPGQVLAALHAAEGPRGEPAAMAFRHLLACSSPWP
ncbi:MAG: BLUF domain-containing protein [Aquabacterium sp.]|nr:BLUF domain-containing protein [Aquabacterium sp.]